MSDVGYKPLREDLRLIFKLIKLTCHCVFISYLDKLSLYRIHSADGSELK
jgi:hypothetical protein